jgi:hypothetical protein
MEDDNLTPARKASLKYSKSEKGRAVQKKIRESEHNKQFKKEWRAKGGHAAEYQRNKDKYRDTFMKRVYGISLEDYNLMTEQQHGLCYVCNNPPKGGKRLAIDHCHTTGNVRRLLCTNCNTVLGLVNEDILIMNKLINYIEEHKC